MLSSSGHSSPMTNLFAANIFGRHGTLSELPFKSFEKTGKKHVESHLTRHELDLMYQKFCFDHKVLMHSLFHQCLNVALSQISNVHRGRNEVRWPPGQEASLASPCSNLTSFGSKRTVMKKYL